MCYIFGFGFNIVIFNILTSICQIIFEPSVNIASDSIKVQLLK